MKKKKEVKPWELGVGYEDLESCIKSKQHLRSCDQDGFCNNCGYQEASTDKN